MTRLPSAAIDIGGRRSERLDSDSNDMSIINSPPVSMSYVEVEHCAVVHDTSNTPFLSAEMSSISLSAGTTILPLVSTSSEEKETNVGVTVEQNGQIERKMDFEVEFVPGEYKVQVIPGADTCAVDGGTLMLTNYRIIFITDSQPQSIFVFTLMELELTDFCDQNQIILSMKGGSVRRFVFPKYEVAVAWHKQLIKIVSFLNRGHSVVANGVTSNSSTSNKNDASGNLENPDHLDVFSWEFSKNVIPMTGQFEWLDFKNEEEQSDYLRRDFDRLQMSDMFRISDVNTGFKVCETYPEKIIVPKDMTDEELKNGATYRGLSRFPAVTWRSTVNNAVLMRSAQPQVGILSWRNPMDEKIIELVTKSSENEGAEQKKFVILDARTYAAAFANRARSGGFENTEYYQQAILEFLGLPNIHTVRNSFVAMRSLLHNMIPNDQLLSNLQNTGWLQNLSNLLHSAYKCANYLKNGHSVLVHCSDGWDRTTQIVSLAKIIIDSYYRTIEGFEELVRKEWLDFGHKFYDRQQSFNGNWDAGERSPIFLQFLEAVRHLQRERSTEFEFTHAYLIKLAQHTYSGLFGTFLFNSKKEKLAAFEKRDAKLVEIWSFLGNHNEQFVNIFYDKERVEDEPEEELRVDCDVLYLRVWHEVFTNDDNRYNNLYPNPQNVQPTLNGKGCALTPTKDASCGSITSMSNGAGMVKSKSSESVSSISIDGNTSCLQHNGTHSGSNGKISSFESGSPQQQSLIESQYNGNTSLLTSTRKGEAHDVLDNDGLLKYKDAEQESSRRQHRRKDRVIKNQTKAIEELHRERNASENFEVREEGLQMNGHRIPNSDEVDSETSSLAKSDFAVIDKNSELPSTYNPSSKPHCQLCGKEFGDSSYYCGLCSRYVCNDCSTKNIHEVVEGQGKMIKVCEECYNNHAGSLTRTYSFSEEFCNRSIDYSTQGPFPSLSSLSLNTSTMSSTQSQPIPSSCKSSSNSISSPRPSPGELTRYGSSSQAVKG